MDLEVNTVCHRNGPVPPLDTPTDRVFRICLADRLLLVALVNHNGQRCHFLRRLVTIGPKQILNFSDCDPLSSHGSSLWLGSSVVRCSHGLRRVLGSSPSGACAFFSRDICCARSEQQMDCLVVSGMVPSRYWGESNECTSHL